MYKACHTEQSSLRQRQIAEVFLDLVQETPLERLRVADLCREAGVARKVFYRYFEGKEDVLLFLADTLYNEMQLQFSQIPFRCGSVRREECRRFFQFWAERKRILNLILEGSCSAALQDVLLRWCAEEHPALAAQVEQDWRRKGSMAFLASGLRGLLLFWRDGGYRQTPEELAALLLELLN